MELIRRTGKAGCKFLFFEYLQPMLQALQKGYPFYAVDARFHTGNKFSLWNWEMRLVLSGTGLSDGALSDD